MAAQPQPKSQQQQPPDLAAITSAIGAGELLPPEAVVGAVPVGGVLTIAAAAAAVAGILSAFDSFNVRRQPALRDYLVTTLQQMYPERTGEDILRYVREELARDREFVRNQRDRLEGDLQNAMTLPPEQRGVRVNAVIERERRYLQMHEQAALERAAANVNFLNVRDESPQGALWMLGTAKTHTPACLAAAGKVWSWRVLDKFSPAVHAGCRCTLVPIGHAIQRGWMHADQVPDDLGSDAEMKRAAAIAKHDHILLEAAEPEEIEAFVEAVVEAVNVYRLPKGAQHGGEFAKRGDLGIPSARSFIRKALHDLVPHLPTTPAQRRRDRVGEWKEVLGHQVWVPEHRGWEREVAGHRFYSPPGTTEVYDKGKWIRRSPASVPVEQREMVTDTAQDTARMWEHQARGVAKGALAERSPDKPPAEVGGHPRATHEGMLQAGFRHTRQQHGRTSITNHYEHVSGAKAEVTYAHGQVSHVKWTPGFDAQPAGPLLDRPPKNTDEFLRDVFNLAHALADENGNVPHMSRVEINPSMFDMSAQHDWEGVTQLGQDTNPALWGLFDATGSKRRLTYSESRLVYALYRAAAHEALHAAAPISQRDYSDDPVARALEEALTEEMAVTEAVKMLRRQGLIDVLRWVKQNPTDFKVEGNYAFYRAALSEIFDRAGLAPEKRANAIAILKFGFHPADRVNGLGSLVAEGGTAQHGPSMEEAREWVKGKLTHADRRMDTENSNAEIFTPNVRADLSDVPSPEPVMVRGVPVYPGSQVVTKGRGVGKVQAILHRDDGPLFDVSYETGLATLPSVEHGVHPEEIQQVVDQPEGVASGAGAISIDGVTFKPGDTVSYLNGISGHGRTTATVERIVRTSNRSWSAPEKGWQMEAVTADGEPVLLDARRAKGLRQEIPAAASPGGERNPFEQFGPLPETLTWKKRYQGEYESSDGRLEMVKLEGVRPPAWNVQFTLDYESAHWETGRSVPEQIVVDGARSMKDARGIAADEWEKTRAELARTEAAGMASPGGERIEIHPVPAMLAADVVPTQWQIEHGYAEMRPDRGFTAIPYKPVIGGREDKDALRMLHHYLTGSTDGWTGSRKQKSELIAQGTELWKQRMKDRGWVPAAPGGERDVLDSLNPTGGMFVDYDPEARATAPLGGDLTTLDKTMGVEPHEPVTIYRGAPREQQVIAPGDYVTTNRQAAQDYAGVPVGHVIEKEVPASHVLDDASEPLSGEYIYRPPQPDEGGVLAHPRGPFYIGTEGAADLSRPTYGTRSENLAALNAGPRGVVSKFWIKPDSRWEHEEERLGRGSLDGLGYQSGLLEKLRADGVDVVWSADQLFVLNPDVLSRTPQSPGGERAPSRKVSEFVKPPKSGKLAASAKETLGALDRTLRVPDLGEAIPIKATAGKNARGGFVRDQVGDVQVEKWEGPTVRLARMRPAAWPAKLAAELQPGDVIVESGGYRARVLSVERVPKAGAFGRPREDGAELIVPTVERLDDKGEVWGDPYSGHKYEPGELVGFDWKPKITGESKLAPGHIRVSASEAKESHSAEATLAHEIAHYLDATAFHDPTGQSLESGRAMFRSLDPETQQGALQKARDFGEDGRDLAERYEQWLSGENSPMDEWWRAVQATDAVEQLSSANMMEYGTHKYLLRPHELFARSFAQWLAMRGGSEKLAEWLRYAQNVPEEEEQTTEDYLGRPRTYMAKTPMHLRIRQWQDDDFAPVAAALDRMFESLGWRIS